MKRSNFFVKLLKKKTQETIKLCRNRDAIKCYFIENVLQTFYDSRQNLKIRDGIVNF